MEAAAIVMVFNLFKTGGSKVIEDFLQTEDLVWYALGFHLQPTIAVHLWSGLTYLFWCKPFTYCGCEVWIGWAKNVKDIKCCTCVLLCTLHRSITYHGHCWASLVDYCCSVSLSSSYGSTRMGSSPYGTSPGGSFMPGSSPPVGSVPKSFPHFQHPSHALLEDNGFKQQKYASFSWLYSFQ